MIAMASSSRNFVPTRAAGLARLSAFVPMAGRSYATGRNSDHGPDDRRHVSLLSPYLSRRVLTEAEVLAAVLGRHSLAAAEKFVQEVFWRSYFKGHLETRPAIWQRYRADVARLLAATPSATYCAATQGRTGIEGFDDWCRELIETGYLHNHARMWFASIWIFTLKLPWQLGADFTYRHFIDGDAASNTLSWRWVAGLHTPGKTYLARRDNIKEYTGGRFAPQGLAREAAALTETPVGLACSLPKLPEHLPRGRIGLLLHDDDLHPQSLPRHDTAIAAVGGAVSATGRSPLGVAEPVAAFADGAMSDALERSGRDFQVPAQRLPAFDVAHVVAFAREHELRTLAMAHAPVGPVAETIEVLTGELKAAGIDLVVVRRAFDSAAWPRATRGFFALKEHIPHLLSAAGIVAAQDKSAQGELLAGLELDQAQDRQA
jgi:deoxyribodipyrimidine photo-lyase